jgi:transcriptional regulator with XRE-family HTH domain
MSVAATQHKIAVAMVKAHMEIHISDLLAWRSATRSIGFGSVAAGQGRKIFGGEITQIPFDGGHRYCGTKASPVARRATSWLPPRMQPSSAFGPRLRWWRTHRGQSQLALAGAAEISQRHLSFLESGRTAPSRDMVLRLAAALDLPLRQQNALLLAAGFAPVWRESALAAPELGEVMRALDHMLAQQEPYPAFVVDRRWNLLRANAGAARLTEFLLGPPAQPAAPVNLADALMSPAALRPLIANWDEVALYLLRGVQADAVADGTAETAALAPRLAAYLDAATLQEIRIECFFPADAATAALLRGWAGASLPAM